MTLLELVQLLHNTRNLSTKAIADLTAKMFVDLNAGLPPVSVDDSVTAITDKQQQITELLKSIDSDISNICANLRTKIDVFASECEQQSWYIHRDSTSNDTYDYLRTKNIEYYKKIPKDIRKIAINKIKTHLNFLYPAMEIRPNNMFITEHLVANDPLYLVDIQDSMFSNVKSKWNPIYQKRVRYYTVNERDSNILDQLPSNQFGLIVAADFFEKRPISLLQIWLTEIYIKLRPGGTAIFTFNDCDRPEAVENFNNIYYCYTPGHIISEMCKDIGYIVKEKFKLNSAISWLEIQKPGTLTTIRAGQALGKIVDI